jgi:hypothetical protein
METDKLSVNLIFKVFDHFRLPPKSAAAKTLVSLADVLIGASPTVWWLIELKRNALWSVAYTYVHGTFPTFSYNDLKLNPTDLSPRTGYFENFQSYTAVIYSKFYGPFASHRLTIFHATCDEIYSSCQRTNGSWNGQYYLQWSVLLPSL